MLHSVIGIFLSGILLRAFRGPPTKNTAASVSQQFVDSSITEYRNCHGTSFVPLDSTCIHNPSVQCHMFSLHLAVQGKNCERGRMSMSAVFLIHNSVRSHK